MTIAEAETFYEYDQKDYLLEQNETLLMWLQQQKELGYHCYLDIKQMQELINQLTTWYELKYPENEFRYYDGIIDERLFNLPKLSKHLNFAQLMKYLPTKLFNIINCHYRANSGYCQTYVDKETNIPYHITFIGLTLTDKDKVDDVYRGRLFINANSKNGIINHYDLERYFNLSQYDDVSVEQLLTILKADSSFQIDYSELIDVIHHHETDLQLRKTLLQLTALSLLYSKNTIPEHGYERAKRFIGEFNKHLPDLKLDSTAIDEIMAFDYSCLTRKETSPSHQECIKQRILMNPSTDIKKEFML